MGRRVRSFKASALIDSHINQYTARLHELKHVTINQMGGLITWYKYAANDNIGMGKLRTDIMFC